MKKTKTPKFCDSMRVASITLNQSHRILRGHKAMGCPAFRYGRVYIAEYLDWLDDKGFARPTPKHEPPEVADQEPEATRLSHAVIEWTLACPDFREDFARHIDAGIIAAETAGGKLEGIEVFSPMLAMAAARLAELSETALHLAFLVEALNGTEPPEFMVKAAAKFCTDNAAKIKFLLQPYEPGK